MSGAPLEADELMDRALVLAERGRRTVSPNPLVGCVITRDGVVVGEGWHERPGGPHAEVAALAAAGEAAGGATAYVTLEPCVHSGRTPPCTEALLRAGVARVEVALADPHPIARGGAEVLRAAGVEVAVGRRSEAARRQNRVFLHGVATGRPYVVMKTATSLDGRIAAADGTSRWLTGPAARQRVHRLRAEVDAVVVGSGTVLADDPELTARDVDAPRQPLRVVLDGRGRTPATARVLDAQAPSLVLTSRAGSEALGAAPHAVVDRFDGALDLDGALTVLWDHEVRSVLVEGGAQVASAFLAAGLVDRLEVHLAPIVLGERGRPLVLGGPRTLAAAQRFSLDAVDRVEDDVILSLTA